MSASSLDSSITAMESSSVNSTVVSYVDKALAPALETLQLSTGFFSLPLKVRQQIYRDIMQQGYPVLCEGVPAILRSNLQITQEIYDHCTLTISIANWDHKIFSNWSRNRSPTEDDFFISPHPIEFHGVMNSIIRKLERFRKNHHDNKGLNLVVLPVFAIRGSSRCSSGVGHFRGGMYHGEPRVCMACVRFTTLFVDALKYLVELDLLDRSERCNGQFRLKMTTGGEIETDGLSFEEFDKYSHIY